jgi:hypothetical protein
VAKAPGVSVRGGGDRGSELVAAALMATRWRAQGHGDGVHARGERSAGFIGGVPGASKCSRGNGGVRTRAALRIGWRMPWAGAQHGATRSRHALAQASSRLDASTASECVASGRAARPGPGRREGQGRHAAGRTGAGVGRRHRALERPWLVGCRSMHV